MRPLFKRCLCFLLLFLWILPTVVSCADASDDHPSGVAVPSPEDVQTTHRMAKALSAVEIVLVDHIVVADGDYVSMVQSGHEFTV